MKIQSACSVKIEFKIDKRGGRVYENVYSYTT